MGDTTHSLETVPGFEKLEFDGCCTVKKLDPNLYPPREYPVPTVSGIYLVIRKRKGRPKFLPKGTGGKIRRKDKNGNTICRDPNVCVRKLEEKWVKGTPILYIGRSVNLRTRIRQLIRFGNGETVPHGGGRYLWQIPDAKILKVCWIELPKETREKKNLFQKFKQVYQGQKPFANIIEA